MHLLMCAIHSCFSVDVAAYTANDLDAVRISHPFRNSEKMDKVLWVITEEKSLN
jgi:hypothetical protein